MTYRIPQTPLYFDLPKESLPSEKKQVDKVEEQLTEQVNALPKKKDRLKARTYVHHLIKEIRNQISFMQGLKFDDQTIRNEVYKLILKAQDAATFHFESCAFYSDNKKLNELRNKEIATNIRNVKFDAPAFGPRKRENLFQLNEIKDTPKLPEISLSIPNAVFSASSLALKEFSPIETLKEVVTYSTETFYGKSCLGTSGKDKELEYWWNQQFGIAWDDDLLDNIQIAKGLLKIPQLPANVLHALREKIESVTSTVGSKLKWTAESKARYAIRTLEITSENFPDLTKPASENWGFDSENASKIAMDRVLMAQMAVKAIDGMGEATKFVAKSICMANSVNAKVCELTVDFAKFAATKIKETTKGAITLFRAEELVKSVLSFEEYKLTHELESLGVPKQIAIKHIGNLYTVVLANLPIDAAAIVLWRRLLKKNPASLPPKFTSHYKPEKVEIVFKKSEMPRLGTVEPPSLPPTEKIKTVFKKTQEAPPVKKPTLTKTPKKEIVLTKSENPGFIKAKGPDPLLLSSKIPEPPLKIPNFPNKGTLHLPLQSKPPKKVPSTTTEKTEIVFTKSKPPLSEKLEPPDHLLLSREEIRKAASLDYHADLRLEEEVLRKIKRHTDTSAPTNSSLKSVKEIYENCEKHSFQYGRTEEGRWISINASLLYQHTGDTASFLIGHHFPGHTHLVKSGNMGVHERTTRFLHAAFEKAENLGAKKIEIVYRSDAHAVATILEEHSVCITRISSLPSGEVFLNGKSRKAFTVIEATVPSKTNPIQIEKAVSSTKERISDLAKKMGISENPSSATKKQKKVDVVLSKSETHIWEKWDTERPIPAFMEDFNKWMIKNAPEDLSDPKLGLNGLEGKFLLEVGPKIPELKPSNKFPKDCSELCNGAQECKYRIIEFDARIELPEPRKTDFNGTLIHKNIGDQKVVLFGEILINEEKLKSLTSPKQRVARVLNVAIKEAQRERIKKIVFAYDPSKYPVATVINQHAVHAMPFISIGSLPNGKYGKPLILLEIEVPQTLNPIKVEPRYSLDFLLPKSERGGAVIKGPKGVMDPSEIKFSKLMSKKPEVNNNREAHGPLQREAFLKALELPKEQQTTFKQFVEECKKSPGNYDELPHWPNPEEILLKSKGADFDLEKHFFDMASSIHPIEKIEVDRHIVFFRSTLNPNLGFVKKTEYLRESLSQVKVTSIFNSLNLKYAEVPKLIGYQLKGRGLSEMFMTLVPGEPIHNIMVDLSKAAKNTLQRSQELAHANLAFRNLGLAFGELHSTHYGQHPLPKSYIEYKARNLLEDYATVTQDYAHVHGRKLPHSLEEIEQLVKKFTENPGFASYGHDDPNLSNLLYDKKSSKISFVDLDMEYISSKGVPQGAGLDNFSYILDHLDIELSSSLHLESERLSIRNAFIEGYKSIFKDTANEKFWRLSNQYHGIVTLIEDDVEKELIRKLIKLIE